MKDRLIPFNNVELAFVAIYILSLLLIGWLGYRARKENSLRDFYLAGKGIGFFVLLLTLYATQYSGNTLFGFSGKSYRIGYAWLMSIHFMTAIIVFYLLLAPKLYTLAKKHHFITPVDFLQQRFNTPALNLTASVVMVIAISNYLLAQLMAMGNALEGLTQIDPATAYTWGVVILGLVIVVYESLGGFRAVAWTDMIQGIVLIIGFIILLCVVFNQYGTLEKATQTLLQAEQEVVEQAKATNTVEIPSSKVQTPDMGRCREWLSYILIVGLGGALYPQSIQRIYASRSAATLRRSLGIMAFMPLTTVFVAVLVGVIGAAYVPDLTAQFNEAGEVVRLDRSDTLLTVICRQIQESSVLGRWLVVVLFSGILAAIMSTADSVLLSISSMITKDIYGRFIDPDASDAKLTKLGKLCSWFLIALSVILAIQLRGNTTLIQLLDRKFDMLVQLAPAFFLGIHWRRLNGTATFYGLLAGLTVALGLAACGYGRLLNIHPGLYGLVANVLIAVIGSLVIGGASADTSREKK